VNGHVQIDTVLDYGRAELALDLYHIRGTNGGGNIHDNNGLRYWRGSRYRSGGSSNRGGWGPFRG
jgi:hypothetical protein